MAAQRNFSRLTPNAFVSTTNLTTTAVEVIPAVSDATDGVEIYGFYLSAPTASRVVIFRSVDNSVEYFRIALPANSIRTIEFPIVFPSRLGLEVMTQALAGVGFQAFFWKPGAAGVGV